MTFRVLVKAEVTGSLPFERMGRMIDTDDDNDFAWSGCLDAPRRIVTGEMRVMPGVGVGCVYSVAIDRGLIADMEEPQPVAPASPFHALLQRVEQRRTAMLPAPQPGDFDDMRTTALVDMAETIDQVHAGIGTAILNLLYPRMADAEVQR